MNKEIYKLATECKECSEHEITIKTLTIRNQNILFSDYIIRGNIKGYEQKLLCLRDAIKDKYPSICLQMQEHMDKYKNDKIVHLSALKTIVNCIISLEEPVLCSKKIFISHSSKDINIIERFTDNILQLGIGLNREDIFCTSIEEMGIRNGEDIRHHIRNNVQSADFSFLMISTNYKESEICLNEMGAVWATDNFVRYYILPNTYFKEIGWLCDTNKANKLGDPVMLDALEAELTDFYGLPHKGGTWSRQRQNFVEYLASYKA